MRTPFRTGLALLGLLLALPVLGHAQVERFARSEKGFLRDQKRIANTPQIKSLDKLLESRSALTGKRPVSGDFQPFTEGAKTFEVDLGNSCKISGKVQRYDFPFGAVTKLQELNIKGNGQSKRLLDGRVPISIDYDTSFYYNDRGGNVKWHGPVSRLSVLALFHELDHAKVWSSLSATDQDAFRTIYDRKTDEQTLTDSQKRTMVGFERHAWAAALAEARSLRAQGIDLLAGVSRKELMDTINGCLKGYYEYEGKKP